MKTDSTLNKTLKVAIIAFLTTQTLALVGFGVLVSVGIYDKIISERKEILQKQKVMQELKARQAETTEHLLQELEYSNKNSLILEGEISEPE